MDDFQQMMVAHVKKTEEHMASVNAHMIQARQARAEHDKSINCLHTSFVSFRDTYGPMLQDALSRKKFWQEVVDAQKKRSALWVAGGITVLAVYGAGHAAILAVKKFFIFMAGA